MAQQAFLLGQNWSRGNENKCIVLTTRTYKGVTSPVDAVELILWITRSHSHEKIDTRQLTEFLLISELEYLLGFDTGI